MTEIEILQRKLEREKAARKQAEQLVESKTLELYYANEELRRLNTALQQDLERQSNTVIRQRERIQQLVNEANDLIYISSPDGYFRYVNPVAIRLLEYSEAELVGQHFSKLVRPDYLDIVKKFYKNQIASKSASYFEFPVLTKPGKEIWLGQKVNVVERDGEIIRLNVIARDITEQKRAEQEISSLYLRLKSLIENLQAGVLMEDENRRISILNQRFCDLFQIPIAPEFLIGSDCSNASEQAKHLFTNPDEFVNRIDEILQKRAIVLQDQLKMVNGKILERDYIPILKDGIYYGHLWHYEDITERKKTEEEVRRSEEKYRSILENMELGIMEVDLNGIIIKPYPRYCKMMGYEPEELIGKKANDVFLPPEFIALMEAQDHKRLGGQSDVYEMQIIKKSGERIWVLIGGAPIMDEHGKVTGSIGIHFDLTAQKKLQKELEIARWEAEKARDAEKEFLANMSHEIRNPIHSIIGMTNLLYDTHLDKEQLEYVKTIKYSSEILMALVSDILDISKIAEGKMELSPQQFNLKELLDAVGKTIEIRLMEKPITFEMIVDTTIPDALMGDSTFVSQVLLNLLGNSVKFTDQGSIQLHAYFELEDHQTVWIQFYIKDSGIGIEPEKQSSIFERFSQAGKTTKNKYGGTGLGLPITKQLIELQGGTIELQSKIGEGTTFGVRLPFQKVSPQANHAQKKDRTAFILPPEATELRILIVEDNPTNRRYLESILQKWKFVFWSCNDGVEALQFLQREKVDLILMDIRMPNMDGYETTLRLRSLKDNPNHQVPIIALTASALLDERDKVMRVGMNYHLTKPFTPDQLLSTIRLFCNKYNSAPAKSMDTFPFEFSRSFDASDLHDLYANNLEHVLLLFDIFTKNTPQELANLERAMSQMKLAEIAEIAHKIKPTFKMVGLGHIENLAKELETACLEKITAKKLKDVYYRFYAAAQRAVELVTQESERIKSFIELK